MRLCQCCCCRCAKDELLAKRFINLKACRLVVEEKLNLKNFLHDAMDFHAVRQLMVKSRHKILMPTLVLHLTKTKLNPVGDYKSSFGRNLHERTDRPVFTIEDAVSQLKTSDPRRSDVEKSMDEFFMTHLPQQVIQAAENYENNELDEDAIRNEMRQNSPFKKSKTQIHPEKDSQRQKEKTTPSPVSPQKRRKSDFTGAFIDSSEQVAKLAEKSLKSQMGQRFDKMRSEARSDRRESFMTPKSKVQPITLERQNPRVRSTMSRKTFKKEYSKDKSEDSPKLEAITQSISRCPRYGLHRKSKFLECPLENSALSYLNTPVQEGTEWSSQGYSESNHRNSCQSHTKTPFDHTPPDREALDSFETIKSHISDPIGALDDDGDQSPQNTPVDRLGFEGPGPKEDESEGVKDTFGDVEV
jgi:hypothetical protein